MDNQVGVGSGISAGTDTLPKMMSEFQHSSNGRSIWQLVDSLVPYFLLWYVAYRTFQYSYWLTLPVLIFMGAFLVRIFIIFHDCGHGSFFKSRKANDLWGIITGILTFTPYYYWRTNHAKHHATSSNLDKRGFGDVWMMTVEEYAQAPAMHRLGYRLYRNPFVMFLLGPFFILLITMRFARGKTSRRDRWSVYWTNIGILALAALLIWAVGWKAYVLIQYPAIFAAMVVGVWLFYVQHQFEGAYWAHDKDWDFVTASLKGGSYYKLPAVLRWFTGNIGFHHVHHLNSRIPNYYLPRCYESLPALKMKPIGIFSALKSLRFRLWDEDHNKMVGFRAVKEWRIRHGMA